MNSQRNCVTHGAAASSQCLTEEPLSMSGTLFSQFKSYLIVGIKLKPWHLVYRVGTTCIDPGRRLVQLNVPGDGRHHCMDLVVGTLLMSLVCLDQTR